MSQVDICNSALAAIGHDRTISSMSETSAEAALCTRFYPAAKNNVLSSYNWDFASVEASVTLTATETTWQVPAAMMKLVSVRDSSGNALQARRTETGLVIVRPDAGVTTATVRYVSNAALEANFPHLVAEAIVYELASLLFGPLVGNVQDSQGTALFASYQKLAGTKLQAAIVAAESERTYLGGSRSKTDEKKTEIANRAIAKLGGDAAISDFATDQTTLASRIRLLFPSSLDRVIRLRDWDFAAVEKTSKLTGADASGYCRVSLPEDCLRIVRVMDEGRHPVKTVRNRDFLMVEGDGIEVTIRYVSSDIDLTEAPDDFVDLLALDLADRLAPTVLGDAKAAAAVQAQLRTTFGETDMKEANETAFGGEWKNPFLAARS